MVVALTSISATELDLAAHLEAVSGPEQGATASFVGTVRDHSPDAAGTVTHLEYVAHPDAEEVLSRVAGEVAAEYPNVTLAASHRTGTVAVGGLAIVVCAASAHRVDVFDACRLLVERVKAELPMWKKQMLTDGSHNWVGSA